MREHKEIFKEETIVIERVEISKGDVALLAHDLYVQRGSGPGKDVEDWVRAENELSGEFIVVPVKTKAALAGHA